MLLMFECMYAFLIFCPKKEFTIAIFVEKVFQIVVFVTTNSIYITVFFTLFIAGFITGFIAVLILSSSCPHRCSNILLFSSKR